MRLQLRPKGTLTVYNARIVRDTLFGHNIDRDSVVIATDSIVSVDVAHFNGAKTFVFVTLSIVALLRAFIWIAWWNG